MSTLGVIRNLQVRKKEKAKEGGVLNWTIFSGIAGPKAWPQLGDAVGTPLQYISKK